MRGALVTFLLTLQAVAAPHPLFNGRDLDGWRFTSSGGENGFAVEEGVIVTRPGGKGMLWYTREMLSNMVLRVVWKMSNERGNSGIFIRIPQEPEGENYAIHYGIEVQIDDRADDYHRTGTLYSMTKALSRPSLAAGEWNTMDIYCEGLRTRVFVNGMLVTDYDGVSDMPPKQADYEPDRRPRPERGYIGLQNHDSEAVISFREVSVRPLPRARRTRR